MATARVTRPLPALERRGDRRTASPAFELTEWKLHAPGSRLGIVPRTALLDRLDEAVDVPVVSVVAPPGYGKTTLLTQWTERRAPRAAWVSLDGGDNDPAVLLTYLAVALDRIEPIDPSILLMLGLPSAGISSIPPLLGAISDRSAPITLVLDHAEALSNPECLLVIAELALGLQRGSQLVVASRNALPIPAARLRALGDILEIGAADLAMGADEAPRLLKSAGIDLADDMIDDLVDRTEGWPVGLYLAALAMQTGAPHDEVGFTFRGDDRFVSDYLRAELLERTTPSEVAFLTRTSVLDRMSGPLCDELLGTTDAGAVLERLEERNLLVVPLDRRRVWFRYHNLFRELLSAELRRRDPGVIRELHARAADWYEANGMPEAAMDHAQAMGDGERVARLVLDLAQPVWAGGRGDTVLQWMEWMEHRSLIESHPAVAVHGALMFALMGRPGDAARWASAAERADADGTLADGSTMESYLAYLRALLCRDGVEEMRRDARLSWDGLSPGSPYRATMRNTEAMSYLLDGDLVRADQLFVEALDASMASGAAPLTSMILAERGMVAMRSDEEHQASMLADQARAAVEHGRFDDYWTSALVYAWLGRRAAHRGETGAARDYVARAARLRPLLTYALPVVSVQALLELAGAYLGLAEVGGARAVLRQVQDIVQQRPRLGDLPYQAERLKAKLDEQRTGAVGASSLTTAELRLLPLLPTHLSFREIGDRLFLSRHTIKTQAMSIYRKLGVSSRSEAIARMDEIGLHRSS